jgi:putative DNA primase/helicase
MDGHDGHRQHLHLDPRPRPPRPRPHARLAGRPSTPAAATAAPPLGSRYAQAALDNELTRLLATPPGRPGTPGRNHDLNRAAFTLGTLTASGALPEGHVVARLQAAGEHLGLTPTESARTVHSGLTAGKTRPR